MNSMLLSFFLIVLYFEQKSYPTLQRVVCVVKGVGCGFFVRWLIIASWVKSSCSTAVKQPAVLEKKYN